MMPLLIITVLACLVVYLGLVLLCGVRRLRQERIRRERAEADARRANERIHQISNSAMKGHPLVKWRHPQPNPAGDTWYWRARFEGRNALFTDQAVQAAYQLGNLHFPTSTPTT